MLNSINKLKLIKIFRLFNISKNSEPVLFFSIFEKNS